jgi:L-asparaginase II
LALLLDTATWGLGPGSEHSATSAQVHNAARVLRAAGWQPLVVHCGDTVAGSLQTLLTKRGTLTGIPAVIRR